MSEPDDTRSSPAMRRSYGLVVLTEIVVVAALWALTRIFS
jgi:hypothetical protein